MNTKKFIIAFIVHFQTCIALSIPTSSSEEVVRKLMGGLNANRGEFPHQALVLRDSQFYCGASILTRTRILSAAHCVETEGLMDNASRFKIAVGVHDRAILCGGDVQLLTVKNIIIHEKYNWTNLQNDIAIFELKNEIQFNNYVKPVKLAGSNENFTGEVVVSGWGWNNGRGTILQKLTVPLIPLDKCLQMRGGKSKYSITNDSLCFGEKRRDTCFGDSGSPSMCLRGNTYVQCGIVSFGTRCDYQIKWSIWSPGVQTRVASFISWIEEKTLGNVKQIIDQAEPLTSKSAAQLLKLAYEIKQETPNLSLKSRFPKSIQNLIWPSTCRIKNVHTGHYMKVLVEEQTFSNGSKIQVHHIVGETTPTYFPNWVFYPETDQNKIRFRIYSPDVNKWMNDQLVEGFVLQEIWALRYEIHFENDRVPSKTTQQPFYIFNPGKNEYFYEARRSWESWRCGFNQFLDCLVTSEPGKKYDEGKFILDGCTDINDFLRRIICITFKVCQ